MYGTKGSALRACLLAGVALAAITAAEPASAGKDMPAPPPSLWSWSGVYIGAHGGYGWARDPFTDQVFIGKTNTIGGINSNGFAAGFQAGANWESGSWVGGLEIDLSATGLKGSTFGTTGNVDLGRGATVLQSATRTDKFEWLGSGRLRIGYTPVPDLLIFGTAGPAWTRLVKTDDTLFQIAQTGAGVETETTTASNPSWRFGAVAGVGAEVRLWNSNWTGRVEYLHYDFGKSNTFASTDPFDEIVTSGNLTLDVVRAGLSYKLGQGYAGSAGSAMAASMPVKALRPAAAWTWSGFYIGAHAGYGWGNDPFDDPDDGFFGTAFETTGVRSTGFVGGIHAGANWQTRNAWVGGLELDLSGSGMKGSNSLAVPLAPGTETFTVTDRLDLLGSARARVGYLFWPDVMLYGTGGLAWTRLTQTLDDVASRPTGTDAISAATVSWEFGWVAGFGVETRLWNSNWLGRIEYLHYDFGDQGSSFSDTTSETSGHLTADVIRGGLSYKFDWSDPAAAPATSGMPLKARPAVASVLDWSGFYLGGHAGFGWGNDPFSSAASSSGLFAGDDDLVLRTDLKSNGFVAGFQAGANRQMGAVVAGVEIDISATGIKGSTTNGDSDLDLIETNTDRFDTLGSARARLGYLVQPNVLLYGTGGLAWTRVNQSFVDFPNGGTPNGASNPAWEVGWTAGAGGETRLWETNWFWRAEYLHYDFGKTASNGFNVLANTVLAGPGTVAQSIATGHLTTDVVRTGLTYKFN